MDYKVCSEFFEGGHHYHVGDLYPFEATKIDNERCEYLANKAMNGAVAFVVVENNEDERYTQIKTDQLKELLSNAEIPFTEKAKKTDLFKLAEEHALI